jgi:hypothetical protein
MQPSGKARFSAKSVNLAEQLQECFLSQVFGFGWVSGHAQAQTIHTSAVRFIKVLEGIRVALASQADGFGLGYITWICLP